MAESIWPSAKEVRDDLLRVRKGFGMRQQSMLLVKHLPHLRVVRNEAVRQVRNLEMDSRHIAYEVVRCVVDRGTSLGDQFRRVATVTLNLDHTATSLTQRREQLRGEFLMGTDAYMDLEERTFQEIAGVLIGLDNSPCTPLDQPSKEVAALERRWQAVGDFEAVRLIEMGFARLRLSRDHATAVEEAERILDAIPKGVAHMVRSDDGRSRDPVEILTEIVKQIARIIYENWVREDPERSVFSRDFLITYLDTLFWGLPKLAARSLTEALRNDGEVNFPYSQGDQKKIARRKARLVPTLQVLAEIMIELESRDAWEVIPPPPRRMQPVAVLL